MRLLYLFFIVLIMSSCSSYKTNIKNLNEAYTSRISDSEVFQPICDYKFLLEFIAKSKINFKNIRVDQNTTFLIQQFVEDSYRNVKFDKYSNKQIEKNLLKFLNTLYDVSKKNNGVIDKNVFEKAKTLICPLYPFCR